MTIRQRFFASNVTYDWKPVAMDTRLY